ncbi:hypothetical protein HDU80_006447, partial [Chytriomyces hyalinus]
LPHLCHHGCCRHRCFLVRQPSGSLPGRCLEPPKPVPIPRCSPGFHRQVDGPQR